MQRVVLRDDATLERLAQDPEVRIMKDLSADDPARRRQAREDLRQILQTTPRQVAAELDKWIKPAL